MLGVKLCELHKQQGQGCCGRVGRGRFQLYPSDAQQPPCSALGGAVAVLVKLLVPRAAPALEVTREW